MFDDEKVRHVAKLARLSLNDEEVKKFGKQLGNILSYMDILNELDTKNVPETTQVTGLKNVMAEDEIIKSDVSRKDLLSCSELPIDSDQIRVSKTIK